MDGGAARRQREWARLSRRGSILSPVLFNVVLACSTGLALVAGLLFAHLLADAKRRLTLPRLLAVGGLVAMLVALESALLVGMTSFNRFGVMHVAYLDLVIAAPLLGVALLVLDRLRRGDALTPWARAGAALLLLGVLAGLYASFIEPRRLVVEHVDVPVPAERSGRGAVRIGVLADLQTDRVGAHERAAVAQLLAARPDLIVIPGDIFQGWDGALEREWEALRELLDALRAPAGVYFVEGDCEETDEVRALLAGLDIVVLVDEIVELWVNGRHLRIAGVSQPPWTPHARATIDRLEAIEGDGDLRIVLVHRPDAILYLPEQPRTDLVIAGHTHGGQVQVPFLGPIMTLSHVPRRIAAGGLHELDGRRIYLSRGVGMERLQAPRIRFLCPPEVSVLEVGGK